ncbi:hypothetical protein [Streptomyces sp. NBC_01794]|uniref:hypothetical protein n=1 Tax=Streptomyces sp. NBC_01794 TaxID=2975942 RepID=UPI0030872B74|nr:hypothetical protein OIE54_11875 [Streptomyces sp. NBC_01794]
MTATVRQVQHRITLELDTPQPFTDLVGRTRKVMAVRIEYGLSSIADRVDVVVEYADSAALVPPVADIPNWMQALIAEHKPAGPTYRLT